MIHLFQGRLVLTPKQKMACSDPDFLIASKEWWSTSQQHVGNDLTNMLAKRSSECMRIASHLFEVNHTLRYLEVGNSDSCESCL